MTKHTIIILVLIFLKALLIQNFSINNYAYQFNNRF